MQRIYIFLGVLRASAVKGFMNPPPASIYLTEHNIPHRVFRHEGPVHSLEQAAQERGQTPEQVIRSILFRVSENDFVMVLMAGAAQVKWSALRSYLGLNRVTMASEDEVLRITGARIGAVGPFGTPQPLRVIIDESVLAQEEVSIGSGERSVTVIIKIEDLKMALKNFEVGKFS